jgi:Uma2 family endonuclease
MSLATAPLAVDEQVVYPESDGQPMADNTLQFEWITTIKFGADALFEDDPNVFVAGDLLWYPVEGRRDICAAPDVMVVFGRPKGHRRSYQQWREGGIAPQVVFEVLSPSNGPLEMTRKAYLYERFGVEEYYVYDPDNGELSGWIRDGDHLREIPEMDGWVSPRLGVRFEIREGVLEVVRPDGERFLTYMDLSRQRQVERQRAEEERQRAEEERQRAEEERQRAEEEAQRAKEEARRAEEARERAERLAAQLRALGIEPEA